MDENERVVCKKQKNNNKEGKKMRIKVSIMLSDPRERFSSEELTLRKALKILPKPEENYIILELNDEKIEDSSPAAKRIIEKLAEEFLAKFGTCLWTAILLSLIGKSTKAYKVLEETLDELRQKLLSIANEDMGKQKFDF